MTQTLTEQSHQAELLDQLQSHPGWQVLADLVLVRKQKLIGYVAGQVMQGKAHDETFRRQVDFDRGYIHALDVVLKQPRKLIDQYEREAGGDNGSATSQ